jgi:hypothetical protein
MRIDLPQGEDHGMKPGLAADPSNAGSKGLPEAPMNTKLRAALDYLGDKLATHHASRFKPARRTLLDEWLAARLTGHQAAATPQGANGGLESRASPRRHPQRMQRAWSGDDGGDASGRSARPTL